MAYVIRHELPLNRRFADGSVVHRYAVKTLEEARATVVGMLYESGLSLDGVRANEARALPESGGTIELLDRSVIEVRPVDWRELWEPIGMKGAHKSKIIAAYNAYQSSEART